MFLKEDDSVYLWNPDGKMSDCLGGYDVLFFFTMETCDSLYRHVVALGGTRCEYDVFGVSTDEIGDVLGSRMSERVVF